MHIPSIQTERLQLRPFAPADLDDLAHLLADPLVTRYIGDGQPRDRAATAQVLDRIARHWQDYGFGWWAVAYLANPRLIGWCGLKLIDETGETEVLYMLEPAAWGQGLAAEGAAASLRYGFEQLKLDTIIAIAYPQNQASQRVMQKIGMRSNGLARYFGIDVARYSSTRAEFRPLPTSYRLLSPGT